MASTSGTRKLALIVHVSASVGWLGTVVAFLVLALVGLKTTDSALARSSYVAADVVTRFAIVPLCVAALLTGLIQSLGTAWGVFRNYWVIAKLILTVAGAGLCSCILQWWPKYRRRLAERPYRRASIRCRFSSSATPSRPSSC